MGEVVEFPGRGEAAIRKALAHFKNLYQEAGLDDTEVSLAMAEFEPIIRSFLERREFKFNLKGNYTEEQVQAISAVHNAAMKDAIDYFNKQMWFALCNIGGLIGRSPHGG